jgi:hypothetical protein
VNIADPGFHGEHTGDARSAFFHVAAVTDKHQSCFQGVYLAGSHVSEDAFYGYRADGGFGHQVVICVQNIQNAIYVWQCQLDRQQFVRVSGNGHTHIVQQGSHNHGGKGVVGSTNLFLFQIHLDAGFVQQLEHLDGIKGGGAHVHGTVVVIAQTLDGYYVCIFLHSLNFGIGKDKLCGFKCLPCKQLQDAGFEALLFY